MFFLNTSSHAQELVIKDNMRFLALGDSYTIGQSVLEKDRWPNQLGDRLVERGYLVDEVKIVARTGWTTRDLLDALEMNPPNFDYNLVSLLIGVNNQFQGKSITQYQVEFELLLNMALSYAKNNNDQVFVLSIPDYGYTPFGLNYPEASEEIDVFNAINRMITDKYNVTYIDVTSSSRQALSQPELLAGDRLHPSSKMYGIWVDSIMAKANLPNIVTKLPVDEKTVHPLIYPSPATDYIILPKGATWVEISDGHGKVVYVKKEGNLATLDVRFLKQGQYLLRIVVDANVINTRFIKQ